MILNEYANDRDYIMQFWESQIDKHQWTWLKKSSNELSKHNNKLRLRTPGILFTAISLQVPMHFTFQIALAHLPDWTISTIYVYQFL